MISFYLKWTFTEYKELLSIGLDRIWQIVHYDVSLTVPFLESVHFNPMSARNGRGVGTCTSVLRLLACYSLQFFASKKESY